ncbi:hypothetical protein GCM10008014_08250 [Paenibacillus silvae]|uniref:Periplasmic copper-binding protein NosD beta helix domain-containing protein n=1 Tax=Paenibacillus silvae TaxID=1325358 RepID=A0ABQ1Z2W9_9BACL|nr:right-handed parallel beta-helix repeat-containing protein [Paenibacillus silvae]GGH45915.1 hypothetical protein GCM10008014_08250 [Paenibacillus silvae]
MSQSSQLIASQYRNGELVKHSFGEAFYIATAYGVFPNGNDYTNELQALVNLANSEGRSAIFFPAGEYRITYINNDENIYYFGDNASFIGGYTREISQIGQSSGVPVFVDIKNLGAVGDGVFDNTTIIQEAINNSSYGTVIWIPVGSFKVLQLDITNKQGVCISGYGELKGSANTATVSLKGVINITNSADITIENINISGVYSGADDRGIWIADSHNVNVRQNRITNFSQEAIYIWGANDSVQSTNHIYDNYIYSNNFGIKMAINAEYYHIHRNKLINNTWGIYGAFGNCRLDNNQILMNGYGVYLDSSLGSNPDHTSISGNVINHNKNIGLYMANLVNGMQVVDNQILSTVGGSWPTTGLSHSLVMINVKDVQMVGNRIDAATGSYIYVNGHVECRYVDNTFHGGDFREIAAGGINTYIANRYLSPSTLTLHASTPKPIRVGEIDQGVNVTDISASVVPTTLTKQNGWVDDASYQPLIAWKGPDGIVHIQGTVTNGTAGTVITQLPTGLRPTKAIDLSGSAGNAGTFSSIRVYSNGNVQQLSGGTTLLSICASFRA